MRKDESMRMDIHEATGPIHMPSPYLARHDNIGQRTCTCSSGSGRWQRSMEKSLDLASRNLDKKWASLFYEANIVFNVVRHPTFISAV